MRARKHWGWGYADEEPSRDELRAAAAGIAEVFGFGSTEVEEPVPLEAAELPAPRVDAPYDTSAHARATHAWWPPDPADWPAEADEPLRRMASMLA